MKLVDNWRAAPKMLTVWVGAASISFGMLPRELQTEVLSFLCVSPERIPAVIGLIFIVSRLLKQVSVSGENTPEQ